MLQSPGSRGRNALFVFLTAAGPLVLIEIIIRLVGFIYNGYLQNQWEWAADYYLLFGVNDTSVNAAAGGIRYEGYYKFQPDSRVRHGPIPEMQVDSVINNIGLRGPSFVETSAKPEETLRVITLGGSSTFGYHARDEYTYPVMLQKKLQSRINSCRVEVINAGLPNMTTENILNMLKHELLDLAPDIVTLYSAFNDASVLRDAEWWQSISRWLYYHVGTYRAIDKGLKWLANIELYNDASKAIASPSPEFVDAQIRLVGELYRDNIESIVDVAQEAGSRIVFIRQPMAVAYSTSSPIDPDRPDYDTSVADARSRLNSGKPISGPEVTLLVHAALIRVMDEVAQQHAIPLVDNVGLVDARKDRLLTYVHLSEEGNDALASVLAEALAPMLWERCSASGSGKAGRGG